MAFYVEILIGRAPPASPSGRPESRAKECGSRWQCQTGCGVQQGRETNMAAVIRVLYVDDEPALLELCKMFLEESGELSVETIDSASAALVLLKKEPFDVIVSDYLMPGMDGIRFLAEVRAHVGNIPFILFTGKGREEIVIKAIENGADFYLQKGGHPAAQFAELVQKIRAAVERRNSDNALKKSENRYRSLVDTMHDCVAVYQAVADGDDFVFLDFNHAAEIAENITRQEVIGRRVTEVFPGVPDFGILEVFRRVWRTGTPESFPASLYKDNRISGWRDNFVYKLPSGEIVAGYRDETLKMQAEAALRESEVRFRTMIDWTSDWEYWIGPNKEFIYVSPSVERITGYAPGEFSADPELIQRIVHPDDRARWEEHTSHHAVAEQTDHSSEMEFRIIHRNGSPRWIGHTCRAIYNADGTWAGRRISNQDITGRKEAEEALLQNRLQLATAMDLASIVNWEFEVGTGDFTFDDRFYALYGTTAEREGGYRMSAETYAREFVFPDDIPGVGDEIRKLLETTDPLYRSQMEHRIIRRDGEIRWIIARYAPVMGADGHVIKTFGANQDITERKQAEAALRDSLAEKEVLLKEIHHRVKNNLQIVSGLMYLQSKLAKDPQTKDILSACRNRITSMALLHENLFQVSNFSSVSMSPYINNLVKYLADSYDTAKYLTFEVNIPGEINLDIDTGIAIGMIVTELVTNSIKYAFTPGEAGTLEVALHPSGEGMLLTVRDNGKGLPKGYDLTLSPGLGMKLVTNLVGQVHGTMDVKSGKGTAISITFTSGIVTGKGH